MKFKLTIIYLIICTHQIAFAQVNLDLISTLKQFNATDDSIKELEAQTFFDSIVSSSNFEQLDLLIINKYQGDYYKRQKQFSLAIKNYHSLEKISGNKLDSTYQKIVGHGYSQMAQSYLRVGKEDSAIWASHKSIAWYSGLNKPKASAINYHRLAIIYKNIGLADSNEYYLFKGLEIASSSKDSVGIGNYEMALGVMYLDQRAYIQSIESFMRSLEISMKIEDKVMEARTLDKLAIYYGTIGDFDKQKYFIDEQLKMASAAPEVKSFGAAAANAANFYSRKQAYDSAFYYIDQSIAFFNQIKLTNKMLIEMNKKANLLYKTHRLPEAKMLYKDVIHKSNNVYKGPSAVAYLGLAKIALANSEPSKAESLALQAENLHPINKISKDIQEEIDLTLYKCHKLLGQDAKAIARLEKVYASTKNSKEKKAKLEIARIEYDYQLKEREKVFALQQSKQSLMHQQVIEKSNSTRNQLILLSLFITALLSLSYFAQRRKKKDNNLLSHQAIELHQKNEELEALHQSKNELLKENIDEKERRIAAITMSQFENQKTLSKIEDLIEELISSGKNISPQELSRVRSLIKSYAGNESSWDSFVHQFEQVNPNFFTQLKATYPLITVNDLKTCAYLKIGMDNKSIAQVTNASPNTVKSRIHRLKKKMNLAPDESIRDLMMSL